jgi:hypothetical protein
MKRRVIVLGIIIIISFFLILEGCGLFGVSVEKRIDTFLADLNQAPRPNSIRYNFSESCQDYDEITGLTFGEFDEFPWDSIPYTLNISDYDANPVTGTISGKVGGSFGGTPVFIEFTVVKEGFNWYILKLVLGVNTIVE